MKKNFFEKKATATETPICFITDDKYLMPTSVAITSLCKNKAPDSCYKIFILTSGLSKKSKEIVSKLRFHKCIIEIVEVEPNSEYENISSENKHVSSQALYKFTLANIFREYDKLLYLDGDVIVQHDLSELLETKLLNNYAAVVKDYRAIVSEPNPETFLPINNSSYFNSGVMLLNLRLLREESVKDKLLNYRIHGINHFMDQDALNVVFSGRVLYLPIQYNAMYSTLSHFPVSDICRYYGIDFRENIDELCEQACILHYCSPTKPWRYLDSWQANLWYRYYKKSPFKHVALSRTTRNSQIEKVERDRESEFSKAIRTLFKRIHQTRR